MASTNVILTLVILLYAFNLCSSESIVCLVCSTVFDSSTECQTGVADSKSPIWTVCGDDYYTKLYGTQGFNSTPGQGGWGLALTGQESNPITTTVAPGERRRKREASDLSYTGTINAPFALPFLVERMEDKNNKLVKEEFNACRKTEFKATAFKPDNTLGLEISNGIVRSCGRASEKELGKRYTFAVDVGIGGTEIAEYVCKANSKTPCNGSSYVKSNFPWLLLSIAVIVGMYSL